MLGPSWIATFERIPAKLHDTLAITLVTGAEIMMQSLLRLEGDFAIIRGRMAGSTDAGRVIILPYDQIVNLAFTKRMLAPEVEAVFGKTLEAADAVRPDGFVLGETTAPAEEKPAPVAEAPKPTPTPTPAAKSNPPTPGPAAMGKSQAPPSKSILLARLRARLAEQGKA